MLLIDEIHADLSASERWIKARQATVYFLNLCFAFNQGLQRQMVKMGTSLLMGGGRGGESFSHLSAGIYVEMVTSIQPSSPAAEAAASVAESGSGQFTNQTINSSSKNIIYFGVCCKVKLSDLLVYLLAQISKCRYRWQLYVGQRTVFLDKYIK